MSSAGAGAGAGAGSGAGTGSHSGRHGLVQNEYPEGSWALLLARVRSRNVIPFVGAGMSCPTLPTWLTLLRELMKKAMDKPSPSATQAQAPATAQPAPMAPTASKDPPSPTPTPTPTAPRPSTPPGPPPASAAATPAPQTCKSAEGDASHPLASTWCEKCSAALCNDCDAAVHGLALFKSHSRIPLSTRDADVSRMFARLGNDVSLITEHLFETLGGAKHFAAATADLFDARIRSAVLWYLGALNKAGLNAAMKKAHRPDAFTPPLPVFLSGVVATTPSGSPIPADTPVGNDCLVVFNLHDGTATEPAVLKDWVADANMGVVFRLLACTRALVSHRHLVTGPWPAIVTTNWDPFLETAWRTLDMCSSSDVSTRNPEYLQRFGTELPVRYRRHTQQFMTELKAYAMPPRVFKLHGDFNAPDEFVAGHSQYRALMVRDVAVKGLLRHLVSRYSLLFLGYSLSDNDLLSTLDEHMETVGRYHTVHFFLTADPIEPEKADYLHRHYGVHLIQVKKYDFAALQSLLVHLCKEGYKLPKGMSLASGPSFQFDGSSRVTVTVKPIVIPSGLNAFYAAGDSRRSFNAFAISTGTTSEGLVLGGMMLETVLTLGGAAVWQDPKVTLGLGHRPPKHSGEARGGFQVGTRAWRALVMTKELHKHLEPSLGPIHAVLAVTGQAMAGTSDTHEANTFDAMRAAVVKVLAAAVHDDRVLKYFDDDLTAVHVTGRRELPSASPSPSPTTTTAATAAAPPPPTPAPSPSPITALASAVTGLFRRQESTSVIDGPYVTPAEHMGKTIRFVVPILSSGVFMLTEQTALSVMLSAVGDCIGEIQRKGHVFPPLEIVLAPFDIGVLADLQHGRLDVGGILSRSMDGFSRIRAVWHHPTDGWQSRTLRVPLRTATFDTVRRALGVATLARKPTPADGPDPVPVDLSQTLLAAGVIEGSTLELFTHVVGEL